MDQPFDCDCGTSVSDQLSSATGSALITSRQTCLRKIQGAAPLAQAQLHKRGYINMYIWELIYKRDGLKTRDNVEGACASCGYGLSARGDLRCGCKPIILES